MLQPGGSKQGNERFQFFARKMSKLFSVAISNRLVQLGKQLHSSRSDSNLYDAAIVGWAIADDEQSLFQLVEHSSDVRRPADETSGEIERSNGDRMFRLEQPKNVVLLGRQVVTAE